MIKRMVIKRTLCLTLAFLLALSLAACGGKEKEEKRERSTGSDAYEMGLELIDRMAERVSSDTVIQLYTTDPDVRQLLRGFSGGKYSSPRHVYKITISSIEGLLGNDAQESRRVFRGLSEELRTYTTGALHAALPQAINNCYGITAVAASSLSRMSVTFVDRSVKEPFLYLYTFRSGYPAMVAFVPGEGGAVSASGLFLLDTDFAGYSARELEDAIYDLTDMEVEVEEVE